MPQATDNNSVQFFAKKIAAIDFKVKPKRNRDDFINECIRTYKSQDSSKHEKISALQDIIYNLWYLYPHVLGPKRFPARLFEECLQNMVISTIRAIWRYDPDRGKKFSSYLAGWLKDAISISAMDDAVVRPPTTVDKAEMIRQAGNVPSNQFKRNKKPRKPSKTKTRQPLKITSDEHISDLKYSFNIEENYFKKEIVDIIESVLNESDVLTEKEKMVIACRFGVYGSPETTLEGVAALFHSRGWKASKEWIHQLERRALKKIRNYLSDCGIETGDYIFSKSS